MPAAAEDLSGVTAVVTGAASGIGRALARLLARRRAHVHVVDRDGAGAAAVAAEVGGVASTVDVTDADAVLALADRVFAAGPVDLLFNNAGIAHGGPVAETSPADWRRLVDVNLLGVVHGMHAFLPRLVEQDRPAHVVNTASAAGLVPVPGLSAYSATKAAVVSLSDAADLELRGTGVRVHALCPGIIDTDIVRRSTMSGSWAGRQAGAVRLYATRGTSPDVVARQALEGVARGRLVITSPRYQVAPQWLLLRTAPRVSHALSAAAYRLLERRAR